MKKFLYYTIMTVSISAFLISAFMIGRYYYNSSLTKNEFAELTELIVQDGDLQNDVSSNTGSNKENQTVITNVSAAKKYKKLYEKNSDFIGWISIDNTNVNYPVMQTKDDGEYYLKRNFDKKNNAHGVPFADERCDLNTSDNIIIYGHNMKDGTMFADVGKYKNKSFWKEHKIIKFDTLDGYGEYEVFAAFKISVASDSSFKYYNFIKAADKNGFDKFINQCKKHSMYDTGVTAKYGDKLLTLSTCEYSSADGRFVVVAKRIK